MLVVDDLHFGYNDRRVLAGLSMVASAGQMVGIVGPNGSGKTTALRLISGVLRPSAGLIKIDDVILADLGAAQRARLVSVVPQNPQLPLGFRVLDLVLMGRSPHLRLLQWEGRQDLEIVRKAMELTNTWYLAGRPVGSLSGGERQRVQVALALAQEAPLMLLDEPTASLDIAHQTSILDLVRDVQLRRGGVVVAMHDLTLAAQYCDRLILLNGGRSYAEGAPQAVLTRENISKVYGADVSILSHPHGGTPVVLPASGARAMSKAVEGTDAGGG